MAGNSRVLEGTSYSKDSRTDVPMRWILLTTRRSEHNRSTYGQNLKIVDDITPLWMEIIVKL